MDSNHDSRSSVRLAQHPTEQVAAYCATFATGSGELLDHHYEADALLVPRPGHPVRVRIGSPPTGTCSGWACPSRRMRAGSTSPGTSPSSSSTGPSEAPARRPARWTSAVPPPTSRAAEPTDCGGMSSTIRSGPRELAGQLGSSAMTESPFLHATRVAYDRIA